MSAINLYNKMNNKDEFVLEDLTSTGAIIKYITEEKKKFQPMGPNFGIIRSWDRRIKDKREKYAEVSKRGLEYLDEILKNQVI